jgi:hypothetical protein
MQSAQEFPGLWTRSLMAWPDGRRDVSTRVAWLQGLGLFADLRQPPGLCSALSAAACRNALTPEDCLALSRQQGFAGRFEAREAAYEWVRRIDIQPPQATRDIGRLFWRDEVLIEEGVEAEYTEHWHRDFVPGQAELAGMWLFDAERNVSGCMLRVGDWFAYVRGRTPAGGAAPVAGATLSSLVEGAASLQQMQALVDCEISLGRAAIGRAAAGGAKGWRITRSSLPYKLGTTFFMRRQADRLLLPDLDDAGQPIERIWEITELEGDSSRVLDTIPQNF